MSTTRLLILTHHMFSLHRGVRLGVGRYMAEAGGFSYCVAHGEQARDLIARGEVDAAVGFVDGLPMYDFLIASGLPAVNVSSRYAMPETSSVVPDNHAAGRLAAAHLIDAGYPRFAFCGHSNHHYAQLRHDGFARGLREAGHDCRRLLESDAKLRATITPWLKALPTPVGVLASNDGVGRMITEHAAQFGMSVPEELGVMGIDDDDLVCGLSDPPLSSVALNGERIGYEAMAMLRRVINGNATGHEALTVAPSGVVPRESTEFVDLEDGLVVRAIRLIRAHAHEPIQIDWLVDQLTISRRALEVRFRRARGRTLWEEVQFAHVHRAKELLRDTDGRMEQVALASGFPHAKQLSTIFKKFTGQTPTSYRRSSRA